MSAKRLWIVALVCAFASAQEDEGPFKRVAEVEHTPISEISGIVMSVTYENVWWVHNDSGNEPALFAIDADGDPILPVWLKESFQVGAEKSPKPTWPGIEILAASNVDWEDIALHDGKLYLCEMGNNGNARRDLGVYVINEPNPRAVDRMRVLKFIPIRYPDQEVFPAKKWHFDCEGLFVDQGKLYFVTKHRAPGQIGQLERGAKLYRLDSQHLDRENELVLVGAHSQLAAPTGADLSPDGRHLAVSTVMALWVFERPENDDNWFNGKARRIALPRQKTMQAEAVTWDDNDTLRLANEQRGVFTVELSALKPVG